jgi:hypothetical protein
MAHDLPCCLWHRQKLPSPRFCAATSSLVGHKRFVGCPPTELQDKNPAFSRLDNLARFFLKKCRKKTRSYVGHSLYFT